MNIGALLVYGEHVVVDTHTHSGSISSSHPSLGTLVFRLRVFPAAELNAITCPCLTPLGPRHWPTVPLWHCLSHTLWWLTAPFPSMPSFASIPEKENSQAQNVKGLGHFSPYGNFISKN
jgi:hypothetical protein